jgi:hypothetical protein
VLHVTLERVVDVPLDNLARRSVAPIRLMMVVVMVAMMVAAAVVVETARDRFVPLILRRWV